MKIPSMRTLSQHWKIRRKLINSVKKHIIIKSFKASYPKNYKYKKPRWIIENSIIKVDYYHKNN